MGLTYVNVQVRNPANGHGSENVSCFVDSGAIFSLIPDEVLRKSLYCPSSECGTREVI